MPVKVASGIDIWSLGNGEIAVWTDEREFWKVLGREPGFLMMSEYSNGGMQAMFPSDYRKRIETLWRDYRRQQRCTESH